MDSDRWYSASHMSVLDELLEDELGLGELEEQLGELDEDGLELGELYEQLGEQVDNSLRLGESVLGLGESCRRVPIFPG